MSETTVTIGDYRYAKDGDTWYCVEFAERRPVSKMTINGGLRLVVLLDALSAAQAERDAAKAALATALEDRARFPGKPDTIGCMIESHIGNLKLKASECERHAKEAMDHRDRLAAELAAVREALEDVRRVEAWLRADASRSVQKSCGQFVARDDDYANPRSLYADSLEALGRALATGGTDDATK